MSNKRRKIKILTLSWNMGNARADEFGRAIPPGGNDNDIIVLGLQEATWSNKKETRKSIDPSLTVSMTKDNDNDEVKKNDPVCVKQLLSDLNEVLGSDYVLVVRNRNVQMQQLIYAKQSVRDRITKIEKFSENTGFFHVFPNKGGLRISFTIDQTSIAFLSCHLTAHEGVQNCALRNDSVQEILDGVLSNELFHHVIFMGDMNYRITFDPTTPGDARTRATTYVNPAPVPSKKLSSTDIGATDPDGDIDVKDDEEDADDIDPNDSTREEHLNYVYDNITQENWSLLLQYDELNREIAAGRVLKGYKALEPKFPPTFKRVRGKTIAPVHEKRPAESTSDSSTNQGERNYDLTFTDASSEKFTKTFYDPKRMPSYTDRILTHSLPAFEENLHIESFFSCEEVSSSDHKPVIATFTLQPTGGLRDIMKYSSNFVTKNKPRYTTATSFRLKEMKGFDLSEMDSQLFGGKSDPYLVLSADPNEVLRSNKLRTKVISHNLNPVWNDVIDFRLITNDLDGLSRNAHLFLTVWDYDVTNDDDLIGTAVISLADIFKHFQKSRGSDMLINADLIRSGLYQGRIEAKLELIQPTEDKMPIFRKNETPISLYDDLGGHQSEMELGGGHKLQSGEAGCGCVIS